MSARLADLLGHVLDGEPALAAEVDDVFRRADRLRRRRTRRLLAAAAGAVVAVAAAGYLMTTSLLPEPAAAPRQAPPAPSRPVWTPPSAVADPVLSVLAPMIDGKRMHIFPRPPERGDGWRQYSVLDSDGRPHGMVEVAVFRRPGDFCFPVSGDPQACGRAEKAGGGIEFRRYDADRDLDWQVYQTIARRTSDGRTVVVMATGERGTGDEARGRPPLSGAQVKRSATDARMFAAFGAAESCTDSGDCPVFRMPVPAGS